MGSSPYTSGAFETRLRRRPVATPFPMPGDPRIVLAAKAAALGNIAPPGTSRWPVSTLSTSTSQLLSEPKRLRAGPQPPVHGGPSVAARVRASSRIVLPRCRSGPRRARARTARRPRAPLRRRSRASEESRDAPAPRRTDVCARPRRKKTSLPGRMNRCRSARRAVSVRRGSTTTSLPPRAWSAWPCRGNRAPSTDCRWTHGIGAQHEQEVAALDVRHGIDSQWPNISPRDSCLGI